MKTLVSNKRAFFDYEILEKFTCGLSLLGWEVKSIRNGKCSIFNSYVVEKLNELFLKGASISLDKSVLFRNSDLEKRDRKLLLNKSEINNIKKGMKVRGQSVVPLEIIINQKGLIKLNIAIVRGRKKFDKRELLKKRDVGRSIAQYRKQSLK